MPIKPDRFKSVINQAFVSCLISRASPQWVRLMGKAFGSRLHAAMTVQTALVVFFEFDLIIETGCLVMARAHAATANSNCI